MTNQILKTILAGILAGTLVFFVPLILSVIFFFFIVKTIFRLLSNGKRNRYHHRMHFAYASKVEPLNEEATIEPMHPFNNYRRFNN